MGNPFRIHALIISLVLFSGVLSAQPAIDFVLPTPGNGSTIYAPSIYANTSVSGTGNLSAFIDFDRSLMGYWSFDRLYSGGNDVLLMHFDEANGSTNFIEETGKGVNVFGNAQISSSESKFGGSSLRAGQTDSDYITLDPSADWDFGTGDFTIDFWLYAVSFPHDANNVNSILGNDNLNGGPGWMFGVNDGPGCDMAPNTCVPGSLGFWSGGDTAWHYGTTNPISNSTWYHIAVTRSGDNFFMFVNGILEQSWTSANPVGYSGFPLRALYRYHPSQSRTDGYIDELRITKGMARWTSNFTPPSSEHGLARDLVYDSSTYGNNATNNGGVNASGKFGNAFNFNTSSYVEIPNAGALLFTTPHTLESWVKANSFPPNDYVPLGIVQQYRYGIFYNAGAHTLRAHRDPGNTLYYLDYGITLDAGTWYHLVQTFDGTNLSLYVNGELAAKGPGTTSGAPNTGAAPVIGVGWSSTSPSYVFDGVVDEARIWNRVLSGGEIKASYDAGAYRLETNFTNLALGNHTFYAYAADSSGNSNQTETRTVQLDSMINSINFADPTPANGSTQYSNSIYVNTSAYSPGRTSSFIDFDRSLAGYWSFDNMSGDTVYDSSTYGNGGTNYGGTNTSGMFGNAMNFNGTTDAEIPDSQDFAFGPGDFTIEFWANPNDLHNSDALSKSNSGSFGPFRIVSENGNWIFVSSNSCASDWFVNMPAGGVSVGSWQHIAVTRNGPTFTTYLNGTAISTLDASESVCTNNEPIRIGALNPSFPSYNFNGSIDEVRIWKRALSPEEINASFDAGSHTLENNFTNLTLGSHSFYAYAIDSSGNSNQTETRTVQLASRVNSIGFIAPTPEDGSVQYTNSIYVNTSADSQGHTSSFIDFDRSLAGYWSFDNMSGDTVYDSSTYGNGGTNYGGTNTSGMFGNAMNFDGSGSYAVLSGDYPFSESTDYSVELWFNAPSMSGDFQTIINKATSSGVPFECLIYPGSGQLQCDSASGPWWGRISSGSVVDGHWHHMAMAHYSNGIFDVYLDGTRLADQSGSGFPESGSTLANLPGIRLGGGPGARQFNGSIDEVRIWKRALSPEEINASFDAGSHTLERNFTNLTLGNHTFYAYAVDSSGSGASTGPRTVNLLAPNQTSTIVKFIMKNNLINSIRLEGVTLDSFEQVFESPIKFDPGERKTVSFSIPGSLCRPGQYITFNRVAFHYASGMLGNITQSGAVPLAAKCS